MHGALLIAMREVRERRAILAAAVVAALLPFASPLLPGIKATQAADARGAMAGFLALGLGAILAVVLGAGAVGRDLAENRLGFDFARPIGALGIWAGRLGAAIGLTLAAIAIVLAPALLTPGIVAFPDGDARDVRSLLTLLLGALLLVGLAHAASVAFRSRSRWLALDLVGLVVVLLLAASGVRRIYDAFAVQAAFAVAATAVVASAPALWIASALQVARGRTDLTVGHRALSISLWSMLLVVALCVVAFSLWFVAADVDDLVEAWAEPAPAGSWIAVNGHAWGRPGLAAQFLVDTETGRSIRLPPGDLLSSNATLFSADGKRAVSTHRSSAFSPIEVDVFDLDAAGGEPRTSSISFATLMPIRFDLSPSGRRLATLQGETLSVHDLDDGRILAAPRLDGLGQLGWGRIRLEFIGDDRVRVYGMGEKLRVFDLAIDARAVASWTGPEIAGSYPLLLWNRDHERLLLAAWDVPGATLLDGTTGQELGRLDAARRCGFLADGRIVALAEGDPGRTVLGLLSEHGDPLETLDLGPTDPETGFTLGGEPTRGTLLIGRFRRAVGGSSALFLLDLKTGAIRPVEGSGRPIAAAPWVAQELPAPPGSVGTRLVQRERSVWLLDPESAKLRRIAGRE